MGLELEMTEYVKLDQNKFTYVEKNQFWRCLKNRNTGRRPMDRSYFILLLIALWLRVGPRDPSGDVLTFFI